jgi:stage V sporulation protein SpoVS
VPRHLELRPSIAGVPLAGLTALALEATDQTMDQAQVQADALALLTQGGVTVGLDALELDAGPAELRGHGHVLVTGPDEYQAEAHVTATGLDDLIKQVSGDPSMQQAVVFLALARGFAKPEGDHLVWDVVASKAGLTINGAAFGAGKGEKHHPDKR